MSHLKIKTKGDLSASSELHQEAIKRGSEHFRDHERNIADRFKGKSEEEIKSILQKSGYPFAVCFEHWINDFNIATGIRNANGFNAKEVYYVGNKKWDRRGAVGVYNYTDVKFLESLEDLTILKEKYTFVGIDNVPGSTDMVNYHWDRNSLIIFGEEGVGLTPGMQAMCKDIVSIPMYGSVRSFNCGTASGIAMYDYILKQKQFCDRVERGG